MKEMDQRDVADLLKKNRTPQSLSFFRTQFKMPAEFLDDQPMPLNGVIAYGGCFSNYFSWTNEFHEPIWPKNGFFVQIKFEKQIES